MKKTIALAGILTLCLFMNAQTATEFDFTQTAATYPVISGTVNPTNIIAGSDETITADIPIGFSFDYCGTAYTTVRISSNGFISPGNTLNQAAFTNDLAGAIKPVIAPLWDDLMAGTAGSVVYTTQGTAPNRVFIVEFRYMKWWYTAANENRHFQVRLYETSHVIEFYYNIIDAPVSSYAAATIGISDATGGIGHFLSVTPGTTATASSSVSNNNINSAQYLNGYQYRFVPSDCPAPAGFSVSSLTSTSAVLSWFNSNATNIKYHVIPFNPLTQGVLISNASNPYPATGLTPNTTYYIYLQSNCGGGLLSGWAGPYTFKTLCNTVTSLPYTEGFNTSVPPACWSEVMVASPSSPPDWYILASGTTPAASPYEGNAMAAFNAYNCVAGSQARLETPYISLAGATNPIVSYQMYHDPGFSGSVNEGVQIQVTVNGTTWTNVGTLNQRYSTTTGWLQAELSLAAWTGQDVRIGFLGISAFGNNVYIDDVFIGDVPTCLPPTSVAFSQITTSSADVSWTSASGNVQWEYEVGIGSFVPGTGSAAITGSTSVEGATLSPLTAGTTYKLYIRSDCGSNGMSAWSGPFTFTTLCNPVTTLPWTETFQNGGQLPLCWTRNHNPAYTGTHNWMMMTSDYQGAPSGYGGSGYFAMLDCFNAPVAGNPYNLTSVPITIPAPYYKLTYYYFIGIGYSMSTPIIVKISADGGNSWNTLFTHNMSATGGWNQQVISLASYSGQTIMIRFEGYSDFGYGDNNIDIDHVEIRTDKTVLYSTMTFTEDPANNGSIGNVMNLQLLGVTFSSTGILTPGVHYTVENIPAGLSPELEVFTADSACFRLTGNAVNHSNSYDSDSLSLEFNNLAFTGGNASSVFYSKVDTLRIDFNDFLIINECDADQNGSDVAEFIELYDGGTGNYALDGYCLVLYNGSDDKVYKAWDLDGFATDSNGYFVAGTPGIPAATLLFPGNTLQNGADAVALYDGDATDFPAGTILHSTGIVDALVYDNGQPDDPGLLALLANGQPQVNENDFQMGTVYSLQRIPNGHGGMLTTSFFTNAPPTPGVVNEPAPMLIWPADTFYESITDDGSIETILQLILRNDTFALTGPLQENTHFTSQNLPAGLQFQLQVINDSTLSVSVTGNAISHSPTDDVADGELMLSDLIFTRYSSPLIISAARNDLYFAFTYPVTAGISTNSEWKIYPNPASVSLTLECQKLLPETIVAVVDVSGRILMEIKTAETSIRIDVSELSPGLYFIRAGAFQSLFVKK